MSIGGSGGITRRQLERAEEGLRLYRAVRQARETAINIMMANGGTNALAKTHEDQKWGIIADSAVEELGEAVDKMRCGMPYNAKDMGEVLSYYGNCLHERGDKHRALPILRKAVDILKRRPEPGNTPWGRALMNSASLLGVEMWKYGRLEAAAAFEEGVEAERIAGVWPKDPNPHVILVDLYVAMGKYREAIKKARETLPLLKPPADPRGHEREAAMIAMYERHNRLSLWAAVADAYESVWMTDKCAEFHNAVMSLCQGGNIGDYPISVLARCGRMLQEKGDLEQAGVQLNYIFAMYLRLLEPHGGLAHLDIKFLAMIPPLRRLVEVGRAYGQGREQDAWALEQELDETEAIFAALKASALEELRSEIHTAGEEAQGAAAEAERAAREKERKKLTRKQQKRKAAQRRKAEARAAAEAAAAGGAGGGGGGDEQEEEQGEEQGDGVDAMTTAAAGLQLEDAAAVEEEPEPEPKPEPEECAICLNDLEEGTEARLVCTHVFHSGCLERWKDKCMEKGLPYTCGMCRRLVVVAVAGAEA